jgi:hypothetical protein
VIDFARQNPGKLNLGLGKAQAALAFASKAERDFIFGGTAQRLYPSLKD